MQIGVSVSSFVSDLIGFFVDSVTAIEDYFGIKSVNLLGIYISHPIAILILLPVLALGFYIGLRHAKTGLFVASMIFGISTVAFLVMIGVGVDSDGMYQLLFFLFTVPTTFLAGFITGWFFGFVLKDFCEDREGGIICKMVQ